MQIVTMDLPGLGLLHPSLGLNLALVDSWRGISTTLGCVYESVGCSLCVFAYDCARVCMFMLFVHVCVFLYACVCKYICVPKLRK